MIWTCYYRAPSLLRDYAIQYQYVLSSYRSWEESVQMQQQSCAQRKVLWKKHHADMRAYAQAIKGLDITMVDGAAFNEALSRVDELRDASTISREEFNEHVREHGCSF